MIEPEEVRKRTRRNRQKSFAANSGSEPGRGSTSTLIIPSKASTGRSRLRYNRRVIQTAKRGAVYRTPFSFHSLPLWRAYRIMNSATVSSDE
jgi:hypothetical protein